MTRIDRICLETALIMLPVDRSPCTAQAVLIRSANSPTVSAK
jgi:hypothetical protein